MVVIIQLCSVTESAELCTKILEGILLYVNYVVKKNGKKSIFKKFEDFNGPLLIYQYFPY